MSKFTSSVYHTLEFEGDNVSMKLQRLKRADMQTLMPFIKTDEEGAPVKMAFETQAEFGEVTVKFLPNYVSEFSGLKDEDGNAISFDTVITEMYFNGIITSIITKLFQISRLSEEDTKNSDAPSDIDTKDQVPETP